MSLLLVDWRTDRTTVVEYIYKMVDSVHATPLNAISPLVDGCSILLSKQCCHKFLVDFDFLDNDCLKLALSKGLGYGIIVASTMVKLPQVLKIVGAQSGAGLSVFGTLLELLAISFNASYSYGMKYPFTAWGEALFLLCETALIAFLVLWYDKRKMGASLFVLVYSGLLYTLMSGLTPINVLWSLQAANLPLAISGKMIQAYRNLKNKHTGQMSVITIWLLSLGCVARIFTSIQETGDQLVVVTYIVASLANFILVSQVHYYWKNTESFIKKQEKKKRK